MVFNVFFKGTRMTNIGNIFKLKCIRVFVGAILVMAVTSLPETVVAGGHKSRRLTAADADQFIKQAEEKITKLNALASRIYWVNATYINDDTDWLSTYAGTKIKKLSVELAQGAARFNNVKVSPDTARKLKLLRIGLVIPAPDKPGAAEELSAIETRMSSTFAKGEGTLNGKKLKINELEDKMRTSRNPKELKEMWVSWRKVSRAMRKDYQRQVALANEGARELGFKDVGDLWRSGYDMTPQQFSMEIDKLYEQMKPLYAQLHCYMRARLNDKYGDDVQPRTGMIRADLLGNMWAQEWGAIRDLTDLPKPKPGEDIDLDKLLVEKKYTPLKMVKTAEGFFTSLGLDPLPETFWKRSQITKPRDRDVICHASAWNLDNKDDLRIKMCTKVNASDFITLHHELGHNYYQRAYNHQPVTFMSGANDGFHEAIGDFLALSVTPSYLVKIGLLDKLPGSKNDTAQLMDQALDKIAFLPFGILMDKWRWQVFSGQIPPEDYNAGWWKLREKYQGVMPPVDRSESDFDPGGKYHIPANVPYNRYFLARVLQFQFHRAACRMMKWKGPLHQCSIYGNKKVGRRFNDMMKMGQSKPWPKALKAFTGNKQMDATAIIDYFKPLIKVLKRKNQGEKCGW